MYLFYADETNTNPEQDDFFIFGGLTIPISAARDLSDRIEVRIPAEADQRSELMAIAIPI